MNKLKFFKKTEEKKPFFFLRLIIFSVIIGGSIFLLFFNPYLKVSYWNIKGAEMIDEESMKNLLKQTAVERWLIFPQDSFFIALLRSHHFGNIIRQNFKEIENVSLRPDWSKLFFNNFLVDINERQKVGIWCNQQNKEECFFFDKTGYLFKNVPESKGPFIINIKNEIGLNLTLGSNIGDQKLIEALIILGNKFSELPLLTIQEISIINQNHDFSVKTNNNWELYFDPKEDIADSLRVFKALLDEEKIKTTDSIEYIDLRIKNKAYIKRF